MNIDLSHKSIRELRFDRAEASADEKLIASRVESLVAAYNRIERIIGLGVLFHRLVNLDISHNSLGRWATAYATTPAWTPRHLMGAAPWIAALPASLQTLNLSHNGLRSLSDELTPNSYIRRNGAEIVMESDDHNDPALTEEEKEEEAMLAYLRRACPLTVALFFNRASFPHLRELDLSHNDFALSLALSDAVEERWNGTAESFTTHLSAQWTARTTSAVSILSMRGNTAMLALNSVLCGLPALRELHAASCGITDLTAVASAATSCPQLCALDLSDCPVVAAIVTAPRTSLSTFAEMLLLPYLIDVGDRDSEGATEEQHRAMAMAARDLAQHRLSEIEKALPGGRLGHVLYVALLQQIIPQLREIDGGVNVADAREAFLRAACEVLQRGGGGTEDHRPRPVVPRSRAPGAAQGTGQKGIEAMGILPLDQPRQSSPVRRRKVHALWQPEQQRQLRGRGLLPPSLTSPNRTQRQDQQQQQQEDEEEEKGDVGRGDVAVERLGRLPLRSTRRDRSRSARAATLAATAAESTQLRPAVRVTPPAANKSGSSHGNDHHYHHHSDEHAMRHTLMGCADVVGQGRGLLHRANAVENHSNEDSTARLLSFDHTSSSRTVNTHMGQSNPFFDTSSMDECGKSHEKGHNNKNGRFHDRDGGRGDIRAKKNVNNEENDATQAPLHTDQTMSAQVNASRINTDNDNENTSANRSGGSFQRALAALTPLLVQRLRAEGLSSGSAPPPVPLSSAHTAANPVTAASTSSSPPLSDLSAAREVLEQRAHALEAALLASQDRRRNAESAVAALTEQLRADRQLITDQRRESAQLRAERDGLAASNRTARRRLQKRQKDIAYGAEALQRREAQLQMRDRKAQVRRMDRETQLLRAAERLARESSAAAHNGADMGRKTRADVLRERAVRERMAAAAQQEDPLAYAPRRFRTGDTTAEIAEDMSGGSVTAANSAETIAMIATANAQTRHDKTPWRQQTLYDTKHSPYAEESEEINDTEGLNHSGAVDYTEAMHGSDEDSRGERGGALQALTLQQLFEEAAMIRQRQHALQQRMRAVSSGSPDGAHIDTRGVPVALKEENSNRTASYATGAVDSSTWSVPPAHVAQDEQTERVCDEGDRGTDTSGDKDLVDIEIIETTGNGSLRNEEFRINVASDKKRKGRPLNLCAPSSDARCIYEEILRQQRLQLPRGDGRLAAEPSPIPKEKGNHEWDEQEDTCEDEKDEEMEEEIEEEKQKEANISARQSLFV